MQVLNRTLLKKTYDIIAVQDVEFRLVLPSEEELRQEIDCDRQALETCWVNKDEESF